MRYPDASVRAPILYPASDAPVLGAISLQPEMPAPSEVERMGRVIKPDDHAQLQFDVIQRELDDLHIFFPLEFNWSTGGSAGAYARTLPPGVQGQPAAAALKLETSGRS